MPRRGTVAISWWMLGDRLIAPRSKLGPYGRRGDGNDEPGRGLGLGLGQMKDLKAYEALDWLFERQARIENGLARRHHEHGVLVLYDVSSSYFESRHYPLAHYGHSRDHRVDRLQTFTACRARGTACLCGRSVRGQYGGSDDAEIADREAEIALRYQADGCWSATGHDHHGLDRRGSQIIRLGLDYVLACAANSSAGPRPWAAAAVAVR
jgi:hypothetical protein